jgi:DNA-binding transcriptional ArsR family regulator
MARTTTKSSAAHDDAVDRTLAALADPHRRRVVDLLRERPRPAGELADEAGLSPPAMSRHLKTLRESGLVEEARDEFDSRVRIYRLRHEAMDDLKAWLAQTEAMWVRQLGAFKTHLKNRR